MKYYQIYDVQRNQVGLVPNIYENNQKQKNIEVQINCDSSSSKIVVYLGIINFALVFFIRFKIQKKNCGKKYANYDNGSLKNVPLLINYSIII